ncbi:hypothetical protein BKA70DRAFT_1137954 [Coprinopsis sp. MPI-PUGE-AT-0042]|nr:hypothetical protein BKA70DRAFT_1137954 [Coprinopsis sp. MPI-PUGE-AT-0042]
MGKGGGKHLKSALLSQQSRLKTKDKVSHAAHVQSQKAKTKGGKSGDAPDNLYIPKRKGKGKGKAQHNIPSTKRPTMPFAATDRILLIGEGNFSFAKALVVDPPSPSLQHLPASNVTATAYDTEDECYEKYPDAREIVKEIREKGVNVLFGVDATKLGKCSALKGKVWDKVVWNFPHAGKGIADQDRNILTNQLLILGFLECAAKVLAKGPVPTIGAPKKKKRKTEDDDELEEEEEEDVEMDDIDLSSQKSQCRGTVLVTLRNVVPYTTWDLPRLAKNPPPPQNKSAPPYPKYTVLRSFQFHRNIWKGYEHRMTKGERAHGTGKTGEGGEDRTWEFYLKDVFES